MKKYLFDFDGTLVDSMPVFGRIMLEILDEYGAKYDDDIIEILTPLGSNGIVDYFINVLGIKASKQEILYKYGIRALKLYREEIPAKSNVKKVLEELKTSGADLNVLTASPHSTLDVCLKRLGIFDLFTNVWSCDDFAMTKAQPEIYECVARKLGVKVSDVIFLDDNIGACKTAKSAGMTVCGVYDDSGKGFVDELKEIADNYIYDFIELLK